MSAVGVVPQWLSHTKEVQNPVVTQFLRLEASAVPIEFQPLEGFRRTADPSSRGCAEMLMLTSVEGSASTTGKLNSARGRLRQPGAKRAKVLCSAIPFLSRILPEGATYIWDGSSHIP